MTHLCKFLIFIFCVVNLSACSLLSPAKTPVVKTYILSPAPSKVRHRPGKKSGTLIVSTPSAVSGFDTADMMYTQNLYELKHFSEHSWIATPAQMLAPLLVENLQNSGCFHEVAIAPYSGESNYALNTQLVKLQQVFYENTSEVELVIDVTLLDNTTHESIASRRFQADIKADANTPYAGVIAANRAVAVVLHQIVSFVCNAKLRVNSDE